MAHLLGLRTVVYPAPDLARARDWYAAVLEQAPYFDQPFYVGFDVAGSELGLDPDLSDHAPGDAGGTAYWRVADLDAVWARLLAHGAASDMPPRPVGEGVRVARARDPFGNGIGLIEERASA
jgi:predicted enzyme related to lactoylglutathione lyase